MPGSTVALQRFGLPSIENGVVAFTGYHDFPAPQTAGVYTGSGGALTTVADLSTSVPGGGTFTGFGRNVNSWPSLGGGSVAFHGEVGSATNPTGIYLRQGVQLLKVVDYLTPVPNGGGATYTVLG